MLASGGVNAEQLSSNINTVNVAGTFEPLVPLSDTDVEVRSLPRPPPSRAHLAILQGYIRHTHEQAIISAIEEGRRATTSDFYRNLDVKMRRDWEKQKEKLFEELGRHQPAAGPSTETPRRGGSGASGFERGVSPAFVRFPAMSLTTLVQSPMTPLSATSGSLQMHSKMMRYDRVIRRLNEFRKEGYAFGLVSALGEASIGTSASDSVRLALYPLTQSLPDLSVHSVPPRRPKHGVFSRTSFKNAMFSTASSSGRRCKSASMPRRTCLRIRRARMRYRSGG